ncbi:gap junction beta-1 protein-like [Hyla sarda]|uniref:gap junction beta-1 protein-like n=1 Tax=Hyla sarda TaxID=327740 RepID=UPI0024C42880|nr:gap junction beta-1 protein-like [Hyla sarda]
MAMSPEAFQEVETATCLLSGMSSTASKISRAILSILFFIRFGILLLGCKTIWQDEEKDFQCNSTKLLCKPSCFDEFSPISSFNLFSLQMVALLTHSLCVACFTRSAFQAREGWLHAQLKRKKVQFNLHVIGLISRMIIELLFILTYYNITEGFVHRRMINCHSTMCEKSVLCTDVNSAVKNIFSLCLCAASATSAMICLWELVASMQHMNSSPTAQAPCKKQHY